MKLTLRQLSRTIALGSLGLALLVLAASDAGAHWRPRRHVHRRAVIVVGRPVAVRSVVMIEGRAHGTLDFHVQPSTTEVYVNGRLRGTVDDFDGSPQKLHLLPGLHKISLQTPGGQKVTREIDIRAGTELEIKLDLEEGS